MWAYKNWYIISDFLDTFFIQISILSIWFHIYKGRSRPLFLMAIYFLLVFPGGSVVKNLLANAGDMGSIPGLGRSSTEGNGNPLQYSYLGNCMDRGACQAVVNGITKEVRHDLATKQHLLLQFIIIYLTSHQQ